MALNYNIKQQNFQVTGPTAGQLRSQTFKEVTLLCKNESGVEETMQVPVQTCTLVGELREVCAIQLGYIDQNQLSFVVKQGCSYRKLYDSDQVGTRMYVRGTNGFKPQRHKYPHPYGIIGAGYLGLKTAMWLTHLGSRDYVVFDRYDRVGGHAWLEMANKTTRLQTEFPTFHIWYGPQWSNETSTICGGCPTDTELWPKRDDVVAHFQRAAEDFGILPHVHLQTSVENMEIVGKVTDPDRKYDLTAIPVKYQLKETQGGGALAHQLGGDAALHRSCGERVDDREPFVTSVSCLVMWPGALCFPRPVTYKGEEIFGGPIDYAVEMRFDYSHIVGKSVTIVGHGAFTMENIRTCLEYGVTHIHLLCRKINLTCPRVVSWFVNQSDPPISAAHMLDVLAHAYKHVKVDPWDIETVHANKSRTHATIWSKTRFGIGDVYFLSCAYGIMEIVTSTVKRMTYHTLHLENGSHFTTEAILKCTGCLGDWKVDRLLKIKEMRGMYVNGDFRRACSGEADGINAAQFSATTSGPGYYAMPRDILHFWDTPNDWQRLVDLGILDQLPCSRAGEPNEEFPAYFYTANHAQSAAIMIAGASPLLAGKSAGDGAYKHWITTHCIPIKRIIAEGKKDWEHYEKKIRDNGIVPADTPPVPYLYTEELLTQEYERHKKYARERFGMTEIADINSS